MKKSNGFTLVELLAVVAILSLLVIIALPNIIEMFNDAKMHSFLTECKQIYKTSQQQWMSDSMFETDEQEYARCNTCSGKNLPLSGRQEIDYYVKINKAGKVVKFYVTDGTYQYVSDEEILVTDINSAVEIATLNEEDRVKITASGPSSGKNVKLVTNIGSFSDFESVKEINADIVDDGYTYTILETYGNTNAYTTDNAQITLYNTRKFKTNTYVRVYSDSSKSNLLAEINYNDVPQNRYNLSTGFKLGVENVYGVTKKLGNVNINNVYIEMSDDVCMGDNCNDSKLYAVKEYYTSEYVRTYTGPWVKDPTAINKIMTLNGIVFGEGYDLHGFAKCTDSDCEPNEYRAIIEVGVR